jgi:hypothetical protein
MQARPLGSFARRQAPPGVWWKILRDLSGRRVSVTLCKKVSVSLPLRGDSHAKRFFT